MSASSFRPLHSSRKLWWIVFAAGILTLILGTIGNWRYELAHPTHVHLGPLEISSFVYHAAQMLILHSPHYHHGTNAWIEAGRWFGVITLFSTTGIFLAQRLGREFRLLRLSVWRNHHIVCGLGQKGLEVVRSLKRKKANARVVVIDPRPSALFTEDCAGLGVCVLVGDASDRATLKRARVSRAKEVIVVTPQDETNHLIAAEIQEIVKLAGHARRPECFVHLENIHLRDLSQAHPDIVGEGCPMKFFDVFDSEARRVLHEFPLDADGIRVDDPLKVHVVILGFGRMGRSIALRAAKMGHFANKKKLRISVIDRDAERQREYLLFHYPDLKDQNICELEFQRAHAESLTARNLVERSAGEDDTLLHVFVCLDDNARAIEVGMRMQDVLDRVEHVQLFVRIKEKGALGDITKHQNKNRIPKIIPFGMVENTCEDQAFREERHENIAMAIHGEFVKKRLKDSDRTVQNDPAMLPWSELAEDLRESNRQQADHMGIKLRAIGCEIVEQTKTGDAVTEFDPNDVEMLAELEHIRWNSERWLAGWKYGDPSDKPRKINRNLTSWDALDDDTKNYDRQAIHNMMEIADKMNPPSKIAKES